jgi:hypothetical protein
MTFVVLQDVPIQRGCGFRPNDSLVWEKNRGPVYCQPIAVPPGAQACSCRAAPSDIKKMHPNYTKGGMPLCNKDPVRLNMKQPWGKSKYSANVQGYCQSQYTGIGFENMGK